MLTNYLGWHGQPNDLQGIFWFGHFPTSEVFRFPSKASPPEMPNPQALHTPAGRGDGDRDVQQPKASMDESGECLPPIQRESTKYLQR